MKGTKIMIAGLISGAVLVALTLVTANMTTAQELPHSEIDVRDLIVTPLSGEETTSQNTLAVTDHLEESDVVTRVVSLTKDGNQEPEEGVISVTVTFDKGADLPQRSPDVMGVLLDQSGSSYKIGSYASRLIDGSRTCGPFEGKKETEISVTDSTRFVEDATDFSQAKPVAGPSDLHVQQVLNNIQRPARLPECASMLIWGEWQGDRLEAEVILFHDELN